MELTEYVNTFPTSRLLYPVTNDPKPLSVETSSRYPVAPVDAFQFAEKLVVWMLVAAVATGASGGTWWSKSQYMPRARG